MTAAILTDGSDDWFEKEEGVETKVSGFLAEDLKSLGFTDEEILACPNDEAACRMLKEGPEKGELPV